MAAELADRFGPLPDEVEKLRDMILKQRVRIAKDLLAGLVKVAGQAKAA